MNCKSKDLAFVKTRRNQVMELGHHAALSLGIGSADSARLGDLGVGPLARMNPAACRVRRERSL